MVVFLYKGQLVRQKPPGRDSLTAACPVRDSLTAACPVRDSLTAACPVRGMGWGGGDNDVVEKG